MTHPPPRSGPQRALHKLGLVRPIDLALHLPLRYEDETCLHTLRTVREGQIAQIEGQIRASEVRAGRQLLVTIDDGTGTCLLRFFAFNPGMQRALAVGKKIRVRGEVQGGFAGWTMLHPAFQPAGGALPTTLTPVYPSTAGLPQAYLRKAIDGGVQAARLDECVPQRVWDEAGIDPAWTLRAALAYLHRPPPGPPPQRTHPAWRRLQAEELLAQQIAQQRSRADRERQRAPLLAGGALQERLLAALPFGLTGAQRRVCAEIADDLRRSAPMHRLLQGDVGSGKTIVAAMAACICIDAGWQCALMAPTEILATQHIAKLVSWLQPLGVQVAWLMGGQGKKQRQAALDAVASGQAQLVVGTHAMVQDAVRFARLGLAIIDEQHRFGVEQRWKLRNKTAAAVEGEEGGADAPAAPQPPLQPHLLMMTATPIPRTLAMGYWADLDVSTIDELPPGRTPVVTKLVHAARRGQLIERVRVAVESGRQAYWVCPLIEESEAVDLSNATQTHAELCAALPTVRVGLLHSRMSTADKRAVMQEFVAGKVGLLVSTTVIEVGVDVPNASLMIVENAQRFGLSQLHQLRGRVGRGQAASACVLLYAAEEGGRLGEGARERLQAMAQCQDGFAIAQRDLEIRGPGEFLGLRQSGAMLLRFADLRDNEDLLGWARQTARHLLLHHPEAARVQEERWLANKTQFLEA